MSQAKRILFVCQGNIIRSPLAEALFRKEIEEAGMRDQYQIDSAGTSAYHVGEEADPRMKHTAAARGFQYDHRARLVRAQDLDHFDLIIAMDAENYSDLHDLANSPQQREKIRLLREFDPEGSTHAAVPDPYYGGAHGFERTYDIVDRAVRGLLEALMKGSV
jgi:protein-tyrosine phosphatase